MLVRKGRVCMSGRKGRVCVCVREGRVLVRKGRCVYRGGEGAG